MSRPAPTSSDHRSSDPGSTPAPLRGGPRQAVVLIAAVAAVGVSFLGSGALGGTPIAEAAGGALSADATLLAPAGPAFVIWSLIYTALLVTAVVQALPPRRDDARLDRTAPALVLALLLNPAWILVVQAGWLLGSVLVIAALAVALVRLWVALLPAAPTRDRWLLDVPVGLYLGWVLAATAANTAAYVDEQIMAVGPAYALSLLIVVTALSAGLAWAHPAGAAVAAATAWGAGWIAYGRLDGDPPSTVVGVAAAVAAAILVLVALLRSTLRARERGADAHTVRTGDSPG